MDLSDIHAPKQLARSVHGQLGQISSPVPVEDIARALDVSDVKAQQFDGFEGMLLTDKARSQGVILANTSKGKRRARFTIAHELGHFLMEKHQLSETSGFRCMTGDLRESREGRQHLSQETQANQFAIALLAPTYRVVPLLKKDPDLRDAQRMRDDLDISLEACIRLMINSRDEPLAAVWSHNGRVRYVVRSKEFPFISLTGGSALPRSSAAVRAISSGTLGFTELCETHSLSWISKADLELYEQTRSGNNGYAVTMLWADLPENGEDEGDGSPSELGMPGFR
tara:strand:+ start:2130 stop:2978 length:849 start_codon:yes stop_codon:yes gene_type:complete